MRTSTKIIIVTITLFAISLVFYDFGLKAKYLKGDYTNPIYDYIPLKHSGFNSIELDASTSVNVMLVQGPFKVLANPMAMDFLKVSEENRCLIVKAAFSDHYRSINTDYVLYISCPDLNAFKADTRYTVDGHLVTDTTAAEFNWKPTSIRGFTANTMNIQLHHAANVVLENNNISNLNAMIGLGDKSASNFTVGERNTFVKTDINVLNKSRLWVKDDSRNNLNYQLADSATLLVNGATVKHLLKQK